MTAENEIRPFQVAFERESIEDLRQRLRHTRWAEPSTVDDWSQGVPLTFARELAAYWAEEYDFDAAQQRLNAWPQFTTRIDGLGVHFVHARSPHPGALPLVITHGWPGTYAEFLDVIGPLTDPVAHGGDAADAFHVVCPSLPGFGFSEKPAASGVGIDRIAEMWVTLMNRLGYEKYGAQGGDWGSAISCALGAFRPDQVVGIHVNMPTVPLGPLTDDSTDEERRGYADFQLHTQVGTGYQFQQSTRPQTLGYGLVDSPAGQLAWVVEKFREWTDCDGDPYNVFTREQLLDNVSVYWFTATGASSARLYWETMSQVRGAAGAARLPDITVPTGCSIFPREIRRPSRRWAEQRFKNIHWWNQPPRGGHFAAFEQPALFVDEVRSSFRSLR